MIKIKTWYLVFVWRLLMKRNPRYSPGEWNVYVSILLSFFEIMFITGILVILKKLSPYYHSELIFVQGPLNRILGAGFIIVFGMGPLFYLNYRIIIKSRKLRLMRYMRSSDFIAVLWFLCFGAVCYLTFVIGGFLM